jgi:hypothetical protein
VTVAVLVPFRGGCPHRERAWSWVRSHYERAGFEVVVGTSDAEGFSRTQAILDARSQTDADMLVIADADVLVDDLAPAIDAAVERGWAIPHFRLHRLTKTSTERVYAGSDWHGLALAEDPYRGNEAGTMLVLTADAFDTAPPDPRFVGWGSEDVAWSMALRALVGPPWRGTADLVHLWHPPQPRKSRIVGNDRIAGLIDRYALAGSADAIREIVEEARTA